MTMRYLGGAVLGVALLAAPAAHGAVISVVPSVDGTYTDAVPVSPGIYGVELRGGDSGGAATWEIGVGPQTSVPGSFSQGNLDWGASFPTLLPFSLSWTPAGTVSIDINGTIVSRAAAWVVDNAIRISAKRDATITITSVDGQAVGGSVTGTSGSGVLNSLYFYASAGEFADGFTLVGFLDVLGGSNSANELLFTVGNFTPNAVAVSEPPMLALVGLALGGVLLVRRRRNG